MMSPHVQAQHFTDKAGMEFEIVRIQSFGIPSRF